MGSSQPRPRQRAGRKALQEIKNFCGVATQRLRKLSASAPQKAPKRKAVHTLSASLSRGIEDTNAELPMTPTTKRAANHSSLVEKDDVVYVDDIEERILAESRGVTRKDIPCDVFYSTYLSSFEHSGQRAQIDRNAIVRVGIGSWEQNSFFQRLQQALPNETLRDLTLSSSFSRTLPRSKRGQEALSQPDFIFHLGTSLSWAGVELLFEHTQSSVKKAPNKFLQWLRGAWNVFHHQPFRRYLYGILFLQPHALICYADHGCAGYSEPLNFVQNDQHAQFLADFLADFIAEPERRGRDLTVAVDTQVGQTFIQHAGKMWIETPDDLLFYRPCVFGRNVRVAKVQLVDSPENKWVMKNAWEEKILQNPSPPPEEQILRILHVANVRGLPQLHELCRSTVGGNDEVEVLTSEFPPDCENALAALSRNAMMKIQNSYIGGRTSKSVTTRSSAGIAGDQHVRRIRLQRQDFNECIDVRRRLTRFVMSYCQPLREAMRDAGPKELMRAIRDAMIVYYEVYKRPQKGFLHGDISIENIMVPVEGTVLTGGLTYETRRGTLIDWNLCFTADGMASNRSFRSGTPAFLAPVLLQSTPITHRTLAHDMESFFAVILWVASLNYDDEIAFREKPLIELVVNNRPTNDIAKLKLYMYNTPRQFKELIIDYFENPYLKDREFLRCMWKLRGILYTNDDDIEAFIDAGGEPMTQETNDDDPKKEGVFKECMVVIDDYLGDEGRQRGSYQLAQIDAGKDLEE